MRWKTMLLGWGPMGQNYRIRESPAGGYSADVGEDQIGIYPDQDAAKAACEDHLKAQGGPPAAEKPSEAAKAPAARKPASEPPPRSGAHHAPTKGKK